MSFFLSLYTSPLPASLYLSLCLSVHLYSNLSLFKPHEFFNQITGMSILSPLFSPPVPLSVCHSITLSLCPCLLQSFIWVFKSVLWLVCHSLFVITCISLSLQPSFKLLSIQVLIYLHQTLSLSFIFSVFPPEVPLTNRSLTQGSSPASQFLSPPPQKKHLV